MRCVIFIVVNSVYFSKSLRARTRPICLSVTRISRTHTHTRIDSVKIQKYCHPCVRDCASMWGYFSFLSSFHFHLIWFSSVWLRWVEFSLFHCRCYYCYLPFSLNFNILLLFFSVHFHCHNSIIPFFFSSIYTMCTSNIHAQAHVCLFVCMKHELIFFPHNIANQRFQHSVRAPCEYEREDTRWTVQTKIVSLGKN